ncbi:MAG TPA: DUF3826 domain-containing protein [Chitinophagaceae bacterium]|jgi:hypothetical protein|nr:DUF3826 domain-containing protein [Chitinophagaceae bacterium]
MTRFLSCLFWLLCTVIISSNLTAQNNQLSDYEKIIRQRAEKIVATLGIKDSATQIQVRNIISAQYLSLSKAHDGKNEQEAAIRKQEGVNKEAIDSEMKKLEQETNSKLEKLHGEYLSKLSSLLTPEQIELVKDGMTYNVASITYNAYLDMLPQLSSEQKEHIMKWLKEAREQAMDAESSEKKHWWFGKYKGRINNYLSAAGYDMKKEGEEWQKRRNAGKNTSGN